MYLFEWISTKTRSVLGYFKPKHDSSFQHLEEGEMETVKSGSLDMSSASIPASVMAPELVNEPVLEQVTHPQSQPVTAYQVTAGLASLVLSKENLPRISVAAVLTGLSTGFNFLSPYLFGETINLMMSEEDTMRIGEVEFTRTTLLMTLVSAYTLSQIIPNIRDQVLVPVTANNTQKIIQRSAEHLMKKSLNYHVTTANGDMIYLIQKGFSLSAIGTPLLTQIVPTVFEISMACAILSSQYGVGMGFGVAGMLSTYTIYSALTAKPIIHAREKSLQTGNEAWEQFMSSIARYKTIYDFGKLDMAFEEVQAGLTKMKQKDIHAATLPLQVGLGHIAISRLCMLLAVLSVASGVQSGKYSVQEFTALVAYLNQISILLPAFGMAVNQFFAAYPDLKFVLGELQLPDEVVDLHPDIPLRITPGEAPSIEFEEVSFSYPHKPGAEQKPPLFQNLSFTIKPGQKVAFVSESGAGKTTIFNLLYGYYTPSQGIIRINGQDISGLSLRSLQSNISLLGQNPNLFKGSVRSNICYGAQEPKDITDEMIWALARKANLYDFLQTLKLDTDVGENGKALSGGQQQKIAILRGLLKKSVIRLLDEITAPFDSQAATQVLESINKACDGMTSLMITHKLIEAQYVDTIIVLDEGRVIAQGTHNELLITCALYKKLWTAYSAQNAVNGSQIKHETESSSTKKIMEAIGSRDSNASSSSVSNVEPDNASYKFDLFTDVAKTQKSEMNSHENIGLSTNHNLK